MNAWQTITPDVCHILIFCNDMQADVLEYLIRVGLKAGMKEEQDQGGNQYDRKTGFR